MGHRRYEAAKRVGMTVLPCIIRRPAADNRTTTRMIIENVQRTGLHPLDEATAYSRLIDEGMTRSQIAKATGLSAATITMRLVLLDLPADAQQRLRAGHMNLDQAAHLSRQLANGGHGSVTDARCPRHFDSRHPLNLAARLRCDAEAHPLKGRINGIACGACWEATIRDDATRGAAPC